MNGEGEREGEKGAYAIPEQGSYGGAETSTMMASRKFCIRRKTTMKYRMTYTISSPVKGEGAVQSSGKLPNIILPTPTQYTISYVFLQ